MDPDPDPSRFHDLMLDAEPGFEEVLRCVFDIQAHEARRYLVLLDAPDSTVAELAERVDHDRCRPSGRRASPTDSGGCSTAAATSTSTGPRRPRRPAS